MDETQPAQSPTPQPTPLHSQGLGTTGTGSVGGSAAIPRPSAQSDLSEQAAKLSAEVAQLAHEKPQPEAPLVAPQDHADPNPIFPDSIVGVEAPELPEAPKSLGSVNEPTPSVGIAREEDVDKKTWRLFAIGFVLGAVVFGGLTGFLLNSYYNTQKSKLELKATQQLQELKSQSPAPSSTNSTSNTSAPSSSAGSGY